MATCRGAKYGRDIIFTAERVHADPQQLNASLIFAYLDLVVGDWLQAYDAVNFTTHEEHLGSIKTMMMVWSLVAIASILSTFSIQLISTVRDYFSQLSHLFEDKDIHLKRCLILHIEFTRLENHNLFRVLNTARHSFGTAP